MRKITKALALALCICLLSGVAAFVFAAPGDGDPAPTTLNVTNDSHNIVNDFNFSSGDYSTVYMPTGNDPSTQINGMNFEMDISTAKQKRGAAAAGGTAKNIFPVTPFMVPTDTTANGNGLLHWAVNKANTATVTTGTSEPAYWLSDARNARANFDKAYVDGYEFITVDFEFGTDQYAYQLDGTWATGTEVPAGATNVKPALVATPIYFTTYYRADRGAFDSKSKTTADNAGINVVQGPDGLFYASADAVYSEGDDIRLSNEVGVFDHVTFVMKLIKTDTTYTVGENTYNYYKAVKYAYVNGQYLQSSEVSEDKNGVNINLTMGGRIAFSLSGANKKIDNYSLAIDNLCTNWYAEGYAYGENGLNDFFGDGFDASAALYECDDVLYQENYVTNVADRWIEVDGVKYYNINAGLDAITNGSDVVVNANVNYFAPDRSLESFNLELLNGSDFEISKGVFAFNAKGGNAYEVEKVEAMANLALVDGIKFSLYVDAPNNSIKAVSGVYGADFAWDDDNNCYEIVWAAELDGFETNPVKIYYSEGDSLVCSEVILDIAEYAALAAEEYDCGSSELSLLYEILQYKQKALISNLVENVEANLTSNGALKLFDGHLRVQYKIGYNACGIKIHDITNAYKNTLLRDTLVVSYFDGENMVDLTYANGGITHAQTPNQHLFVNVPVEYITAPITISFEAAVALDKTDANNWTYTETVPVTGTYSYAEDAGISAILAINEIFAGHENCSCANIEVPAAEDVDFSALEGIDFMYDNAGVYVYGADDSLSVSYYYGQDLVTLTVGDGIEKIYDGEYFVHGIHAAFLADVITVKVGNAEGTYNLAAFIDYAIETKAEISELVAEIEAALPMMEAELEALKASKAEAEAAKAALEAPVTALQTASDALAAEVATLTTTLETLREDLEILIPGTPSYAEKEAEIATAEANLAAKQTEAAAALAEYNTARAELDANATYVELVASIADMTTAIAEGEGYIAEAEAVLVELNITIGVIDAATAEANAMAKYAAAAKAFKVYTE